MKARVVTSLWVAEELAVWVMSEGKLVRHAVVPRQSLGASIGIPGADLCVSS